MERKRWREESDELSETIIKVAALKASAGVVSIVTHDVPEEMCENFEDYSEAVASKTKDVIFFGCGMIVECQTSSSNCPSREYVCKVLAPASLFKRPSHIDLNSIQIDVFGPTSELYNAKLLGYDFHYNLAVITFKSKSLLPTVTFKGIDEIHPTHKLPPTQNSPFELRPRSNLFKILPGTQIISLLREYFPPYSLESGSGFFSSKCLDTLYNLSYTACNELYAIKDSTYDGYDGGPALNCYGDIIGIMFNTSSFLPSNIITRWWQHFENTGGFRRPFLGFKIANLYDADLDFLAQFIAKFPDISAAVIVTKVEEYSPASCSGLRIKDVIVKVDDKPVNSKLKFFETIWEKDEKSVEFIVLRVTNGEVLNLSLLIEEATPDKFNQWEYPGWHRLMRDSASLENVIDDQSS